MNLVAVLIAPAVVAMSPLSDTPSNMRFLIAGIAVAVIVAAVVVSSRREVVIAEEPKIDNVASLPGRAVEDSFEAPAKQPEAERTN